jgi:hypothetical protein
VEGARSPQIQVLVVVDLWEFDLSPTALGGSLFAGDL